MLTLNRQLLKYLTQIISQLRDRYVNITVNIMYDSGQWESSLNVYETVLPTAR